MSSSAPGNRTVLSGGRKLVYASLAVLLLLAAVLYFRLGNRSTALAASAPASKVEAVRTATVALGDLEETIRLTGTITAEHFHMIQAPQLVGIRGAFAVGNVAASISPSSTPTFTPSSGSNLRGASNRFSDQQANSNATPSTPYTPPASAGSVYNSLVSTQSLRGGGDSDFNLIILKIAAPGMRVKKGDVIAEFDRQTQLLRLDDYKDTVVQLNANIEKMRSDLQTACKAHDQILFSAKSDLDKAQLDLKTAEVRSANEVEQLKLNVGEAKARYQQLLKEVKLLDESQRAQISATRIDRDQAKLELDRAQVNVNLMMVRAPIDGMVVLQTIWRGGDTGQAQQGDQLYSGKAFMEVIDPSAMMLTAKANQVDSERIRIGMKARVHLDAYPGLEFPAHVVGVNALAKPSYRRPSFMGEIDVRLKIDSIDEHVIPDISGSADVVLDSEPQTPIVPLNAIFFGAPANAPYLYLRTRTPGGWERREVQLGLRNNTHAAVRSGVRRGDVIAMTPPNTTGK
jgi:multidrug efflux pump subunit AcrA (membrane-fusion protein)